MMFCESVLPLLRIPTPFPLDDTQLEHGEQFPGAFKIPTQTDFTCKSYLLIVYILFTFIPS